MNTIYKGLSNVRFLAKSYTNKFLFIAFLGIHIPLIGLIIFIVFKPGSIPGSTVFVTTLILTLAATAVTLFILNKLLEPLKQSKNALEQYLKGRKLPNLPVVYLDEAGVLMQKVQETITKLDSLLEEKKDLIAILSHDLRTPLATIKLLSGLIKDGTVTQEETAEIGEQIYESANEQIDLFNDILENLRCDHLDWMQLSLNETPSELIIEKALRDVQKMADNKQVTLQADNHYQGNLFVEAGIFPQVLKNLLSNAIKFSHPRSVVHLSVTGQQNKVKIVVQDNGLGFKSADAELLFQKFTSEGKRGTLNEPSTGMGLYLSRKIVEAHNGTLYGESLGINRGARFVIEL